MSAAVIRVAFGGAAVSLPACDRPTPTTTTTRTIAPRTRATFPDTPKECHTVTGPRAGAISCGVLRRGERCSPRTRSPQFPASPGAPSRGLLRRDSTVHTSRSMADSTSTAALAAPVPDPDAIARAERFTLERFVHAGEEPADALAPGSGRRLALDAALAELDAGASVPSTHWRRRYSLLLRLERLLSEDEPKLADGTTLDPHQVDALSGTLTALIAEGQRSNGNGAAPVAPEGNGAAPGPGGDGRAPARTRRDPGRRRRDRRRRRRARRAAGLGGGRRRGSGRRG